jgi:tetratricopeptide (TPR) repeat protein
VDRYRKNAYRVLGLEGDASLAAAEESARARGTTDAQAALERLRDPVARIRERIFAPGGGARGRCVAAHEPLLSGSGGDAGAWDAALDGWRSLLDDPSFRAWVADGADPARVEEILSGLSADLLEANVGIGGAALARGDVAAAKVQCDVLRRRLQEPARTEALERLLAPAAGAAVATATSITQSLDDLELGNGMQPAQLQRARDAVDAGAARIDALVTDAERLRPFDLAPGRAACDQAALALLRLGIVSSWVDGRDAATRSYLERASAIVCSDVLREKVASARTSLRVNAELADFFEARNRGKVEKARRLLLRKRRTADPEIGAQIDAILAEPRRLMGPLGSLPGLGRVNGVGVGMYGSRNVAADRSYIATTCFCVLFIPLIPIASFLVTREGAGWRFYGRVPLSRFARTVQRTALAAIVLVPLLGWAAAAYDASDFAIARRAFGAAETDLDAHAYSAAAHELVPLLARGTEERRARAEALGERVLLESFERIKTPVDAAQFASGPGATILAWKDEAVFTPAVLEQLERRCEETGSAPLIEWGRKACLAFRGKSLAFGVALAKKSADTSLLASVATWHADDNQRCPGEIVSELGTLLLGAKRSPTWDQDALAYLRVADAAEARPVLFARAEVAWKGGASGHDLLPFLAAGPLPLRGLLAADDERDLAKRAVAIERVAEPEGLEEPFATWHRIGVARRLAKIHGQLNDEDPVKNPVGPARTWAIRAAELSPDDPETCSRAMGYLLEQGELPRVIALGEALGARKTPESITFLGIALSRSGRLDDAEKVLGPYVDENLAGYVKAFAAYQSGTKAAEERLLGSLNNGTGDQAFIRRLNSLGKAQAQDEVRRWIRGRMDADPVLNQAIAELRARARVHAAAFELAMVDIALGRSQAPGTGRDARFKRAEAILLALRNVSGEDPTQEVQLGQVYFWLGKREEGQAIFDRLEKAGDPKLLMAMGKIYRQLDRNDAARRLLELVYAKLPDGPEREGAACIRGLEPKDADDQILWLTRAGSSEFVQAALAQARANQHLQRGEPAAAVPELRRAAAYYTREKDNPIELHNSSTAYLSLYHATGDVAELKEALRYARAAVTLAKDDAIALRQYLYLLESVGYYALAGDVVKTSVLHVRPGHDWLELVQPPLSHAAWSEKIKAQPELRRGLEIARQLMVISPEGGDAYEFQSAYLRRTNDLAALRQLRLDLETAGLSRSEANEAERKAQTGEKDAARDKAVEESFAGIERELVLVRQSGHGPTIGLALRQLAYAIIGARTITPARYDPDKAVAVIEEALRASDVGSVHEAVSWTRLERASRDLARGDERYRAWLEKCPGLAGARVLWLYADKYPDVRDKVRAMEDVKVAGAEAAKLVTDPLWQPGVDEYGVLALAGHELAEPTAKAVAARGVALERTKIDLLLSPQSATVVATALLAARVAGDEAFEKKVKDGARARGLLGPYLDD